MTSYNIKTDQNSLNESILTCTYGSITRQN